MKSVIKRDPARTTGVALELEDGSFVLIHPYYDFDRNMRIAECFQEALATEQESALRQALEFYADRSNWLIESDSGDGYVNRIEWNASGDLWRAPWKRALQALGRAA